MTSPAIEAENQELDLDGQDDQQEQPVPVEQLISEMRSELADLRGKHTATANYVGGLGRQVENLLKQPQSPARDERVDALLLEFEDFRLAGMSYEEKQDYLLKKQREASTKQAEPAPETAKAVADTKPSEEAVLLEEYGDHQGAWAEEAQELGLSWALVWPKLESLLADPAKDDLKRGPSTNTDRRGWHRLDRGVAAWLRAEKALQTNQARRERTPIDTSTGSGTKQDDWASYQKALREGGALPSSAEIDRITQAHYRV